MGFKRIIPPITGQQVIARGTGIRKESRLGLRMRYGPGNWVKMKGRARVVLLDDSVHRA